MKKLKKVGISVMTEDSQFNFNEDETFFNEVCEKIEREGVKSFLKEWYPETGGYYSWVQTTFTDESGNLFFNM